MLSHTQIKALLNKLKKEDKKHTKEFVQDLTKVEKSISLLVNNTKTNKSHLKKRTGKKCRKTRKGRK
jgi:hypothetical protein